MTYDQLCDLGQEQDRDERAARAERQIADDVQALVIRRNRTPAEVDAEELRQNHDAFEAAQACEENCRLAASPAVAPRHDEEQRCPKCGERMWDNRISKRNPKAPDFKCRDRSCDGVLWPPRSTASVAAPDPAQRATSEPIAQPAAAGEREIIGSLWYAGDRYFASAADAAFWRRVAADRATRQAARRARFTLTAAGRAALGESR
jgi:hypothetical protein